MLIPARRRLAFASCLALMTFPLALPAFAQAQQSAQSPATSPDQARLLSRLVVLPFDNLSRQPQDDWLAEAFADSLTLALTQVEGLQLVERTRIDQLIKEISFSQSAYVDQTNKPDLGKLYGAQQMVLGSFQHLGNQLSVSVRIVDVETGKLRADAVARVQGSYDNLFLLQQDLARQLVNGLAVSARERGQVASLLEINASTEAQRWFTIGRQALNNKGSDAFLQQAIEAFQQAIKLSPEFGRAYAGLAEALALRAGSSELYISAKPADDLRQAALAAEQALKLAPELPDVYRARARVLILNQQPELALVDLKRALELEPGNSETILSLLSLEKADLTDFSQLRQRLTELGADFNDPWIQFNLAQKLISERQHNPRLDLEPAIQLLKSAGERLPRNYIFPYFLGVIEIQRQNFEQAEGYLTRAYELESGIYTLWALAQVKQYQNKLPEAKELFSKVLEMAPNHPYAHQSMGDILRALQQTDQARKHYLEAIRLSAQEPSFYFSLAWLEASQNMAESRRLMEKALSLSEPNSRSQAMALMYLGDLAETPAQARSYYARASVYQEIGYLVILRQARLYAREKNYAEAIRQLTLFYDAHPDLANQPAYRNEYKEYYLLEALSRSPRNGLLYNDLALLAQSQGRTQEASAFFERALEFAGDNPAVLYNVGSFQLTHQQPQLAVRQLQRAVQLDANYAKAWYNLALAQIALHQNQAARAALDTVLKLEPGHAEARKLLKTL